MQEYTGNVNGPVLWNLNLLDAQGNAISETYGNGLWLQNGYDAATGEPLTRQAGTGGQASNVQNLSYAWDDAGNLSSRQDLRQSLTESFSYDALDRLTLASGSATQSTAIGYDAIGNLTSKSGVGSYTYHSTKKHAVASAGGAAYTYDANGNLVSRGGATVSWTSDNLPSSIGDPSGYSAQFSYAPDRSRWRQVSSYAGGSETTIYVGGLLEKLTTATRTHWKHLIPTPSGQVQVMRRSDGTTDTLYVTTDHLGSTDAVLNAVGTVLMRGSFTVHGARRASNWQGAPATTEWQSIASTTRRGYTGHEHLDNVMLIHMNGRVFDPTIGRFLSADPYIDGPETTQGWNRYAYVHGRLMSATDPSGFEVEEVVVEGRRLYPTIGNYFIRLMLPTISRDYYSRGDSHGDGAGRSTSPPLQTQACYRPADNGFDFNDFVNFSAGLGDVLLLGFGDEIRAGLDIGSVDTGSSAYGAGEVTGSVALLATGVAGGIRAAGARGAGMEFSHAVPARMGGPRSIWNGNFVTRETHALSDPYRYRFMSRGWKEANPMLNRASQLWTRTPNTIKGTAAGAGAAGAGLAGAGC